MTLHAPSKRGIELHADTIVIDLMIGVFAGEAIAGNLIVGPAERGYVHAVQPVFGGDLAIGTIDPKADACINVISLMADQADSPSDIEVQAFTGNSHAGEVDAVLSRRAEDGSSRTGSIWLQLELVADAIIALPGVGVEVAAA